MQRDQSLCRDKWIGGFEVYGHETRAVCSVQCVECVECCGARNVRCGVTLSGLEWFGMWSEMSEDGNARDESL